jgi:hypothetical protein
MHDNTYTALWKFCTIYSRDQNSAFRWGDIHNADKFILLQVIQQYVFTANIDEENSLPMHREHNHWMTKGLLSIATRNTSKAKRAKEVEQLMNQLLDASARNREGRVSRYKERVLTRTP